MIFSQNFSSFGAGDDDGDFDKKSKAKKASGGKKDEAKKGAAKKGDDEDDDDSSSDSDDDDEGDSAPAGVDKKQVDDQMKVVMERLKENFNTLRIGRATPGKLSLPKLFFLNHREYLDDCCLAKGCWTLCWLKLMGTSARSRLWHR